MDLGQTYTRAQISTAFGLPADDPHAVIVADGKVIAIVVNKNGRHPNGKRYQNGLNETAFKMQGEYEWRGKLLENSSVEVPLFFSHGSDGKYRHEGTVRYVRTADWVGEPFYEFKRETAPPT